MTRHTSLSTPSAIIVDASDPVASKRFFEAVFPKREDEGITFARKLIAAGKIDEARRYLDFCNSFAGNRGWKGLDLPDDLREQLV